MFKQPLNTTDSIGALKSNPKGTAKLPFIGSNGEPQVLPINLTTASITLHSTAEGALDEVYIWASNYGSAAANILISIDDPTYTAGNYVEAQLNSKNGLVLIYPGIPHNNQTIYVKASANNSINIVGFVVRNFSIRQDDKEYGYHNSGD